MMKFRRCRIPEDTTFRDNLIGWMFISPAVLIIFIFGVFPIAYAIYMSFYRWQIRQGRYLGMGNYERVVGDWFGTFLFVMGFLILYIAYKSWLRTFENEKENFVGYLIEISSKLIGLFLVIGGGILAGINVIFVFLEQLELVQENTNPIVVGSAIMLVGIVTRFVPIFIWNRLIGSVKELSFAVKLVASFLLLGLGMYLVSMGWSRMMGAGNDDFLVGLTITFWYAFCSVPVQLILGLVLAYVLFQNIRAKQWYRMIFFLPYVVPEVAMAVVFRVVFSPRETSLANQFLSLFGIEAQSWISEPEPFVNILFGLNLEGFVAGPSMALVSVVLLGIWKYTGYSVVIFLAGLGSIPHDLYEAAKVDGGTEWHLFRHITLPLLSPVTFYLTILAFIGMFKAFNNIYVMRTPFAQGTTDVASIAIFDTFYKTSQFGFAAAQAIVLFLVILALTGTLRNIFEKRVFYG